MPDDLFMRKFLVEWQPSLQNRVVYSVKPLKSVFHYDQDKTFSPRDNLTPRIIAYPVMHVSKSFVTRITLDRFNRKRP